MNLCDSCNDFDKCFRRTQWHGAKDCVTNKPITRAQLSAANLEINTLKGEITADEDRLEKAAIAVWGEHIHGCDTPEHLADLVQHLTAEIERLKAAHVPVGTLPDWQDDLAFTDPHNAHIARCGYERARDVFRPLQPSEVVVPVGTLPELTEAVLDRLAEDAKFFTQWGASHDQAVRLYDKHIRTKFRPLQPGEVVVSREVLKELISAFTSILDEIPDAENEFGFAEEMDLPMWKVREGLRALDALRKPEGGDK